MTTQFWEKLSKDHSCKFDELLQGRHDYILKSVLEDTTTGIESVPDGFILYGDEQSLLIRPHSIAYKEGLSLFEMLLRIFKK